MGFREFFYRFTAQNAEGEDVQVKVQAEVAVEEKKEVKMPLSNDNIMKYIVKHFEKEMNENSFDDLVTFPMTFTVIMNQKDFNRKKDYAPLVAKQTIKKFYESIRKEVENGKSCENLATYWSISFVPCGNQAVEVDENNYAVEEGDIAICCSVHDRIATLSEQDEIGSQFSVTLGGSEIYGNVNINYNAIKNLNLVGEAHFQFPWDPALPTGQNMKPVQVENPGMNIAKLFNEEYTFNITGGTCEVSGPAETRLNIRDLTIFQVNNDYVNNGHIRIQYIKSDNKFKMAAFDYTTLNGMPMETSSKNDIHWVDLTDGARITLADQVTLTFKTLY